MSDQPDLAYIQRRFDTLQKELREGLHTMQLRDDQRESSYQSLIATLTRQMVQVATEVDVRLTSFEELLSGFEHRLGMRMARTDDQVRSLEQRFETRMDRFEAMLAQLPGKEDV